MDVTEGAAVNPVWDKSPVLHRTLKQLIMDPTTWNNFA